ncbi:hypothetical protein D4764_05G0002780 [Takifugu flavidus]|uniref:Uncharacterized protein n=1 Tax=Takifugu flavidus TaxID=433684 RepID=A0A5C6N0F4_9TELE|nr:hypothetical protein D4764_05G0002780 [Takifugu flavidus]
MLLANRGGKWSEEPEQRGSSVPSCRRRGFSVTSHLLWSLLGVRVDQLRPGRPDDTAVITRWNVSTFPDSLCPAGNLQQVPDDSVKNRFCLRNKAANSQL